MNAVATINDTQVSVISYQSKPVVTTEMLAHFYGTDADNIKQNFSRNSDRFVEGKHYFKLEGTELKAFKNMVTDSHYVSKRTARLMLWTERGAARHAKMLDTEQAWDVFTMLEDRYFANAAVMPITNTLPAKNKSNNVATLVLSILANGDLLSKDEILKLGGSRYNNWEVTTALQMLLKGKFIHRIHGHYSGRDFVDTKYHVIR